MERSGSRSLALVALAFAAAALLLYAPALRGDFIADDLGYVLNNPWIQTLDAEHLRGLFDPFGDAALFTANYAPLHLLAHALEWQVFGAHTTGYHVVNVVLHAIVSALLVAVFVRAGIPGRPALLLGAVFLVHPANVEAVAWIFQLKTVLSLGLCAAALLAFRARPGLATLLFAAGLLAKFSSAFAWPVAAAQAWARGGPSRRELPWLAVWAALLALAAWPEFFAFERLGHASQLDRYPDVFAHARSIFAFAGRYLVMALTSYGVAGSQEPPPALSWTDPWWLFGLLAVAAISWRTLSGLRARREEAAFWIWAAAGFAPISQIFPFLYPMADRYLYHILPGLLGGGFLAGRDAWRALARSRPQWAGQAGRVAWAAGAIALVLLAAHAARRTPLWRSEVLVVADAAAHYPEGISALYLRARLAAEIGDRGEAARAVERMAERGFDGFLALARDPALAALVGTPAFDAALERVVRNWIASASGRTRHVQGELHTLGQAYLMVGERENALRAFQRGLAQGGPQDDAIRAEIEALRAAPGAR